MFVIKQETEAETDVPVIRVYYHGDGLENAELVRVYDNNRGLTEEALEHALVALRQRHKQVRGEIA